MVDEGCEGDVDHAKNPFRFEYPFPPDAVVDFFRRHYGPMSRAFASLDANGQDKLRSELVQLCPHITIPMAIPPASTLSASRSLQLAAGTFWLRHSPPLRTISKAPRVVVLNYSLIASRKRLPTWLPSLKAFRKRNGVHRCRGNGSDGRSVGVIVHHVASVYPIEIDLARAIADGADIPDVTWRFSPS